MTFQDYRTERLQNGAGQLPASSIYYFDVTDYVCPSGMCNAFEPSGTPRYFDDSHLSMIGSAGLGKQIVSATDIPDAFELSGLVRPQELAGSHP